ADPPHLRGRCRRRGQRRHAPPVGRRGTGPRSRRGERPHRDRRGGPGRAGQGAGRAGRRRPPRRAPRARGQRSEPDAWRRDPRGRGHRDGPGRDGVRAVPHRVADERRGGARAGTGTWRHRDRLGEVHQRRGGAPV
ncbi:MAG: Molybdate-binding domain of ModE, partial [uncultured Nocardioidaceae bacterium]